MSAPADIARGDAPRPPRFVASVNEYLVRNTALDGDRQARHFDVKIVRIVRPVGGTPEPDAWAILSLSGAYLHRDAMEWRESNPDAPLTYPNAGLGMVTADAHFDYRPSDLHVTEATSWVREHTFTLSEALGVCATSLPASADEVSSARGEPAAAPGASSGIRQDAGADG